MHPGEENIKMTRERILSEMRKMQSCYHSLLLCGTTFSLLLFIIAFSWIDSWWGRILAAWFGASILAASAWVYLKAYRELQHEMHQYRKMLGTQKEGKFLPGIQGLHFIRRLAGNPYFLSFTTGVLLSLLFAVHVQDKYETSLFTALSRKVTGQSRSLKEDSLLIRSMNLSHDLLAERTAIYNNADIEPSWIGSYLQPLSQDLITANGACGSYSVVLCRILQGLHYETRLLQMKDGRGQVCHIIVEALSSRGWVVLDPLYKLYFKRPDGRLASFNDVSRRWDYYHTQVPASYDPRYNYAGAQYTNWNKLPLVMPVLKKVLGMFMTEERLQAFSLRVYFLRKYRVMEYITLFVLAFPLALLISKSVQAYNKKRIRQTARPKKRLRKIGVLGVDWRTAG